MSHAASKRIPEHKRWKHTGKGREHSFLQLFHYMLKSSEFEELSPIAIKLLLDLAKNYNGGNNGNLSAPWSVLSKQGWSSENTMRRALSELLATEFLLCTRQPMRKRCGLYALTWLPIDRCERAFLEVGASHKASHLWRNRSSRHGCKPPTEEQAKATNAATTDG